MDNGRQGIRGCLYRSLHDTRLEPSSAQRCTYPLCAYEAPTYPSTAGSLASGPTRALTAPATVSERGGLRVRAVRCDAGADGDPRDGAQVTGCSSRTLRNSEHSRGHRQSARGPSRPMGSMLRRIVGKDRGDGRESLRGLKVTMEPQLSIQAPQRCCLMKRGCCGGTCDRHTEVSQSHAAAAVARGAKASPPLLPEDARRSVANGALGGHLCPRPPPVPRRERAGGSPREPLECFSHCVVST